jgi:predicted RNA-binding Zn ribbon-like protein
VVTDQLGPDILTPVRQHMDARDAPDLLLDLVESHDGGDLIGSPERLRDWFVERGLIEPGATVSAEEWNRARHLRAAVRDLFAGRPEGAVDERTRRTIEEVAAEGGLRLKVSPTGDISFAPGSPGAPGALARIVAELYEARLRGTLDRYKACQKCGWAFYDSSKNRSRRWCDMASCGSQVKAQAYRARKKSAQK